jgi:hypothetical protein
MTARFRVSLAAAMLLQGTVSGQHPPTFRTETRLVALQAVVKNDRGELVTNLDRSAFTVYEDGKRQSITLFRRDDIPVSLGLLIDNSGSMRTLRSRVEAAALTFVRASNPQDEVFVLNFADKPRIDVPLTSVTHVLRPVSGASMPSAERPCEMRWTWLRPTCGSTPHVTARSCS